MKKEPKTKTRVQSKRRGILLVDDHPLFRKGTVQLLGQEEDIEVRAEADSTRTALEAIRREKFDLAIVDVGLGGGANGIELTKMIKAEQPELPVLVVSMHDEALYAERALRAGARGYVMKREALDSILNAIRDVLSGEIYVSPSMSKRMLYNHIQGRGEASSPVERLTDGGERRLLLGQASGLDGLVDAILERLLERVRERVRLYPELRRGIVDDGLALLARREHS